MRDTVVPGRSFVRLPAALAGVALGLLTGVDPAAAEQTPRPLAPSQAHGGATARPPHAARPTAPRPGSGREGRTPAGKMHAAASAPATTAGPAQNSPALGSRARRSRADGVSSPEAGLALKLLVGLNLSPHPGAKVCADTAAGTIKLGVHLALGADGCLPKPSAIVAAPVKPKPAPVTAQPSPLPASPAPAGGAVPSQPPAAAVTPAIPPANLPSASPPGANSPSARRTVPTAVRHDRPVPAAGQVQPQHQSLLKNIMVLIIVVLVIAAFTGGLFAGFR